MLHGLVDTNADYNIFYVSVLIPVLLSQLMLLMVSCHGVCAG